MAQRKVFVGDPRKSTGTGFNTIRDVRVGMMSGRKAKFARNIHSFSGNPFEIVEDPATPQRGRRGEEIKCCLLEPVCKAGDTVVKPIPETLSSRKVEKEKSKA